MISPVEAAWGRWDATEPDSDNLQSLQHHACSNSQRETGVPDAQVLSSLKSMSACVPSQKGLFFEPPQRHRV